MIRITIPELENYRKGIDTRIKSLRNAGIKSHRDAAHLMSLKAKRNAPRKSGALIAGIRTRYGKVNSSVESTVPKDFPYNLWINQTPPFQRIRLRFPFTPRGLDGRKKYGYNEIPTRTGMAGFFDRAVLETAQEFPRICKNHISVALSKTHTGVM
jgi:hypothetical protein